MGVSSALTSFVCAASALVSLVTSAAVSALDSDRPVVYHDELLLKTLRLCEILQFEFIFVKGCQTLESAVLDAIDHLKNDGIISEVQVS